MKRLLREAGIPVTAFRTIRHDDFIAHSEQTCSDTAALGFPLFTKPANAGSSVGVRKVTRAADLADAMRYAFQFDTKILAEAAVQLKVSEATVRRLIAEHILPAYQLCKGAPWVIRADEVSRENVQCAADARRLRHPPSGDPRQNTLIL